MMKSMTAFGRAKATVNGKDITVEIRSVNSRYLDCNTKISRAFSFLEEKIKPYLQSAGVTRGKVDVSISVGVVESTGTEISIDECYARAYINALYTLRDRFHLPDDVTTLGVARNQDIFTFKKPEEDTELDWADIKSVLDTAIESFVTSREAEGANIEKDLREKIGYIKETTARISAISERNTKLHKDKLRDRIMKMLEDNNISIDEGRILTECAIFADKIAIDEEIVRLGSHFDAFERITGLDEAIGRKLDFLIQEMNREVNTIGSKSQDAEIAHLVVDVKTELEKIREQIQNIE